MLLENLTGALDDLLSKELRVLPIGLCEQIVRLTADMPTICYVLDGRLAGTPDLGRICHQIILIFLGKLSQK